LKNLKIIKQFNNCDILLKNNQSEMDIITIFQELPDITTIQVNNKYLVVNKSDRPKISKTGSIKKSKIRRIEEIFLMKETNTSFLISFTNFGDGFGFNFDNQWILKQDFFNKYQVIELLEDVKSNYVVTNTNDVE